MVVLRLYTVMLFFVVYLSVTLSSTLFGQYYPLPGLSKDVFEYPTNFVQHSIENAARQLPFPYKYFYNYNYPAMQARSGSDSKPDYPRYPLPVTDPRGAGSILPPIPLRNTIVLRPEKPEDPDYTVISPTPKTEDTEEPEDKPEYFPHFNHPPNFPPVQHPHYLLKQFYIPIPLKEAPKSIKNSLPLFYPDQSDE